MMRRGAFKPSGSKARCLQAIPSPTHGPSFIRPRHNPEALLESLPQQVPYVTGVDWVCVRSGAEVCGIMGSCAVIPCSNSYSWAEAVDGPWGGGGGTLVEDAVVHAAGTALPEFDGGGDEAVAAP